MKLSNLEITSELRVTQPAAGDESGQTIDIKFGIDTGCTVAAEFYELLLYEMLNGRVNGEEGAVTTGIKAVYYDQTNAVYATSSVVKLDKVMTETGTELVAEPLANKADSTVTSYITKVELYYVANDADVADDKLIFTSIVPQKTTFAEATGVGTGKGIAIPANAGAVKVGNTFKIFWK